MSMYKNAYQYVSLVLSLNSQTPGVKNIYFINKIIPCTIIITNLAQGIILLFKEIFLTSAPVIKLYSKNMFLSFNLAV